MKDGRIALTKGTIINFPDDKVIQIKNEAGRGGHCIVYDADYFDSIGVRHFVKVKEFFPCYLPITRESSHFLAVSEVSESNRKKFESEKEFFIESYRKNAEVKKTLGLINSTVNSADIVRCNNTVYTMMTYNEGTDYSKYQDHSLKECLTHIRSLAILIQKYHQNGYLHLDIKPENILIIPETDEHIFLLDFDSVILLDELSQNGRFRWYFSDGFSAPEQIQGKISRIGTHTDIYSIGATAFYKLFGRKPSAEDCRFMSTFRFENMQFASERYQPELYRALRNFFAKTLSVSVISRWHDMQNVIDQLDKLISLADTESIYLIDSFQYNSACFVGRRKELEEIHHLLDRQVVFLSGIGGIGKTELAKKYAQAYREQYRKIIFAVFDQDIQTLVCNEIIINNIKKDENESDGDYFKRKIEILGKIACRDDLIIIDNFDVESDENLEILLTCPCQFIITTRTDFRDFGYEQIYVDSIKDPDEILKLFCYYNDTDYSDTEKCAVNDLISYVENHTMTVELIAKYLRISQVQPSYLYQCFQQKEGTTATDAICIKQRKDRKLRSETVNRHLRILFDISGFNDTEREILGSLSLLTGIRISKQLFIDICMTANVEIELEYLIRTGWTEYNEISGKVSLHQVIQDLIYSEIRPDEKNCPHTVTGMTEYVSSPSVNNHESKLKQKVFSIFMDRLSGDTLSYAKLCLLYGEKNKLNEAEKICLSCDDPEAFDILQRIYSKKLRQTEYVSDTTEENFDYHAVCQLTRMNDIIDKIILYCQKYSEEPDYIAKEFIFTGLEVNQVLQDKGWCTLEPTPELNRIFDKVRELFDTAEENLASASYPPSEKKKLYKKLLDFYSGRDLTFTRNIFYDPDKSYKYLQIVNGLTKDTDGEIADIKIIDGCKRTFFDSTLELWYIADKFEEEKEYEKAIDCYRTAYEEGEESYESTQWNIAKIYLKTGREDEAIDIMKEILATGRKYIGNDLSKYYSYSSDVCIELIKLLTNRKKFYEARNYAEELIDYKLPDIRKKDNACAVKFILACHYCLYELEHDSIKKASLWQECLKYFKVLDDKKIECEILDFLAEYIKKEHLSYEQIIKIIDRIDQDDGIETRERIIKRIIEKYSGESGFEKYHILFLLKMAEPSCKHPYNNITGALLNCEDAQKFYDNYGMKNAYIQNLIFEMKAELLSNISDYNKNELKKTRNQCDYKFLAEYRIAEHSYSLEEQIKIWQDTANKYGLNDNEDMKIICLNEGLKILKSVLNQYDFSQADRNYYYNMTEDLIWSYIQMKNYDSARQKIYELYNDITAFSSDKLGFVLWNYIWKLKDFALYLKECFCFSESIRMYLIALYVGITSEINTELSLSDDTEKDVIKLCRKICELPVYEVEPKIADSLLDCKDKLIEYKDYAHFAGELYEHLITRISDKFQYQTIEFKKTPY